MARKTIRQRIALDGGDQIKKELEQFGAAGEKAFRDLQAAADRLDGVGGKFVSSLRKAQRDLEATGKAVDRIGQGFQRVGTSLTTYITTPLLALAGVSVKAFAEFEQGMANIGTLTDDTAASLKAMGDELLGIAEKTPVAIGELQSGLYDVRSAGIGASDAMGVLQASANLAVAGLGDTKGAVGLVTSALNAFKINASEADRVAGLFFNAIKNGKTTADGLAQGFGGVASIVNAAGVSLEEFLAATSALTTTGQEASQSYTQLKAAIGGLTRESKDSVKVFKELGVTSFKELIRNSGGLVNAFRRIRGVVGDNDAALLKLVGSQEGLNAILSLTGAQYDSYIKTLNDSTGATKSLAEATNEQTATAAAKLQILKNNVDKVRIALGDELLPVAEKIGNKLLELAKSFNSLAPATKSLAVNVGLLAAALGPVLIVVGSVVRSVGGLILVLGRLAGVIAGVGAAGAAGVGLVAGIGLLLAALVYLGTRQSDAEKATSAHTEALAALDKAIQAVKDSVPGSVDELKKLAKAELDAAQAAAEAAKVQIKAAQDKLREVYRSADASQIGRAEVKLGVDTKPALKALDEANKAYDESLKRIAEIQDKIANSGIAAIGGVQQVAEKTGKAVEDTTKKVADLGKAITVYRPGDSGPIKETFNLVDGVAKATEKSKKALDDVGASADKAGADIARASDSISRGIIHNPFADIPTQAQDAADSATTAFEAVGPAVSATLDQVPQKFADIAATVDATNFEDVTAKIVQPFQAAADKVKAIAGGFGDLVKAGFDSVLSQVQIAASAITAAIDKIIADLQRAIDRVRALKASAASAAKSATSASGSGGGGGFAGGGYIRGPGTSRSDSIPAWLSDKEFVINAASVRALGLPFLYAINRIKRAGQKLPGLKAGGQVSRQFKEGLPRFNLGGLADRVNDSLINMVAPLPAYSASTAAVASQASGGVPVIINLPGGEQVNLTGDQDVARKLQRYALGSSLASLGARPNRRTQR